MVLGVNLAVFALLGEIAARSFDLVDRLNGFPRRLFTATDDPDLPYRMRPGTDTTVRGFHVQVNEHGLRGPSFTTTPAAGVYRILALGDSATFGEGMAVEEAWPALLQRALDDGGAPRVEVINAGVEGYNTQAELAWLRQSGFALGARAVVVGYNLNDFDFPPVMGPLGILTRDQSVRVGARSLANRSELYLLLRWLWVTFRRDVLGVGATPPTALTADSQRFQPLDRYVSAIRKQYYRSPHDGRWGVLARSLHGLGEAARANGLDLLVAIFPDGDQVGVPAPDLEPQRKVLAMCDAASIECLDLHPAFAAAAGEELFFDTMHPNVAGQRIIAREIAARLRPMLAAAPP